MDGSSRPAVSPLGACAVAILAVSTASIFIRYAQAEGMASLAIAALRLDIATLVLAPIVILRCRQELAGLVAKEWILAGASGLFLAAHFATWIRSLEYTTVASSVVLVGTVPLWVALASPLLLGEHVTRRVTAGIALAVAGGAVVGLSEAGPGGAAGSAPLLGNALALAGAITGAAYFVCGRRLRRRLSLTSYVFVVYGTAALALSTAALSAGVSLIDHSAPAWLWCVLLALVPQLLGHSTFNWALRYLPAATVSVMVLGEPVGSTILAYLLLAETPAVLELAGGALILTGVYLASVAGRGARPS